MVESPMVELLLVNPVHFVNLPAVPLPITSRFAPAARGMKPADDAAPELGLRLKPRCPVLPVRASNVERSITLQASAGAASLVDPAVCCACARMLVVTRQNDAARTIVKSR